ncbi:MAG: flagellar hook-associated protein 3 [Spirochaetes bacterium]|nr:flagellar hook-associated protein 3 [Spirochaetota bacterium]
MSVYRISSMTIPDSGIFHVKNKEYSMDKVNTQINTGKKHRLPRENVVDVTQAMTYHSKIHKLNQFIRNINDAQSERRLTETKIQDTIEILQRARELAVQGANGIYSQVDRKNMAIEIDQLLRNAILNANAQYKGNFLFSGYKSYTKPFEDLEGNVRGINDAMITEVKYLGDNGKHLREIDVDENMAVSKAGSEVFWAEQFQIYSTVNTADFRLTEDQTILIDGHEIKFDAGDNAYAIVEKINQSPAAVQASLDVFNGGLILKTTVPHKLELADIEGGNLLQNLGIIQEGNPIGPENYAQTATVFSGSVFDVFIGLRDSLLQNNQEDIGGRYLGAIDGAIDNLLYHITDSGAMDNRLTYLENRHEQDKMNFTESLGKIEDVDMAEAIMNLKNLEFAHKASLSSIARLSRTSLMDFLR